MKLHIVFVQRHEAYPGQNAPEALHVIDEYSHYENPEWIVNKLEETKAMDEFQAAAIVTLDLPGAIEPIRERLIGTLEIEGEIEDG